MKLTLGITLGLTAVVAVGLALTLQAPPVDTVQRGYRGTAMQENYDPRLVREVVARNAPAPAFPALPAVGPKASAAYQNVQVLGDLSVGQFTRLMASITTWVAPQQGCNYCHNPNNMASDALYTKVVARRMLQMVRQINVTWKSHVQGVGVTCYTCHRGQPVPSYVWYLNPGPAHAIGMVEGDVGKNHPSTAAGLSSLPDDPFAPFLLGDDNIRVQPTTALPDGDRASIKQTDWTYALMIHFSQSLGVNCTFCHNTRALGEWSESTPQRVTAWYGIRMVRDVNQHYLGSLAGVFPANRLGPTGDVPKVDCATCHQGAYQPLFGQSILAAYPELDVIGLQDPLPPKP